MQKHAKILVGTDLGPAGDQAIETAHAWCQKFEGTLVVMHAIGARTPVDPLFPQRHQGRALDALELQRAVFVHIEERVRKLTGREPGTFEVRVVEGAAAEQILAVAHELSADLVVLGGRTAGGTRWVFGSVAERVVTYADLPVLVARPDTAPPHIIAATDFSEPSLPAVAAAHELSHALGAKATIVHCVERDTTYSAIHSFAHQATDGADPDEIAAAHKRLREISDASPDHDPARVVVGDPAEAIVALAETLPATVIVVASRGRTGLARLMLGSVAGRVVRHAPCSVYVVRLR